uniref:Cytochrome P450 n=1 Tax=Parascaris univalens TaxID=6257 RepID=A0A915BYI5_PARUN
MVSSENSPLEPSHGIYLRRRAEFRLPVSINKIVFLFNEHLQPILESNTELVKGRDYDFFRPWLGDGLLTSSGNKWKARRKMLTPAFHFKMLQQFVSVFDTESKILVEQLDHFANTNREVDILPFVKRCALDIICSAFVLFYRTLREISAEIFFVRIFAVWTNKNKPACFMDVLFYTFRFKRRLLHK